LPFVALECLGESGRGLLVAALGGEDLREIAPCVSLESDAVVLLVGRDRLAGESFRLCVLTPMREDTRLNLPPERLISRIVTGKRTPSAAGGLALPEAAARANLPSEQSPVHPQEPELFSLLEPRAGRLEVTCRRLVVTCHPRDLGETDLADPPSVELALP